MRPTNTQVLAVLVVGVLSMNAAVALPMTITNRLERIAHNIRGTQAREVLYVVVPGKDGRDKNSLMDTISVATASARRCNLLDGDLSLTSIDQQTKLKCEKIVVVGDNDFNNMVAKTVLYSFGARCGVVQSTGTDDTGYKNAVSGAGKEKSEVIRFDNKDVLGLGLTLGTHSSTAAGIVSSAAANVTASGAQSDNTVAIVVLGNEAIDDGIPTVDHVQRTLKAVTYAVNNPSQSTYIVATGGRTDSGLLSEAQMTQVIAMSRGFPFNHIVLENSATNTAQNAQFSARLIDTIRPKEVFIVSKRSHLKWALPMFHNIPEFKHAEGIESSYTRRGELKQMTECLPECSPARAKRVTDRIAWLKKNVVGPDM